MTVFELNPILDELSRPHATLKNWWEGNPFSKIIMPFHIWAIPLEDSVGMHTILSKASNTLAAKKKQTWAGEP